MRAARVDGPALGRVEGVEPGEVGLLLGRDLTGTDVTATLVDLALGGFCRIEEQTAAPAQGAGVRRWRLVRTEPAQGRPRHPKGLAKRLHSAALGRRGHVEIAALGDELFALGGHEAQRRTTRPAVSEAMFWYVFAAVWLCALGFIGGIFAAVFGAPLVFAVLGLVVCLSGLGTLLVGWRRARAQTADQRLLRHRVTALRTALERTDARQVAAAENQDGLVAALPYAVALGSTARWADVMDELSASGLPLAAPSWYVTALGGVPTTYAALAEAIDALAEEVTCLVESGESQWVDEIDDPDDGAGDERAGEESGDEGGADEGGADEESAGDGPHRGREADDAHR